ncbi:MAG: helix-turn-helix transcriptional regulator [Bacteroidetes bacterium]|nr:helix-turn-helix transcriptional regulator [Bacteroidota bacterium]
MKEQEVEYFVNQIGKRICELRKERNMTQLDLSVKVQMEENAVQRLETGRSSPTAKTLYKITRGLEVEMWEFFKKGFEPMK